MARALNEFQIDGLETLIPFHRALLASEQWARGETCRDLLEDRAWLKATAAPPPAKPAGAGEPEPLEHSYTVEVSGRKFDVRVIGGAPAANGATADGAAKPVRATPKKRERAARGGDTLASPMQGNVWKVPVAVGQKIEEGELVTIIEAMKMENEIPAHKSGVIAELPIAEGDLVRNGDVLAVIKDAEG
jgi:acetyl-CoA/propionyl-CoA carboxylase biotin carboxyl carrier protein